MSNRCPIPNFSEEDLTEAIAEVIRNHRLRLGISRDELAKQLELHKNTLYYIEVGTKRGDYPFRRQQISLHHFSRMAYYFGVSPSDMLGEVFARVNAV